VPKSTPISEIYLSIRTNLLRAVSRIVPPHEIEDDVQRPMYAFARLATLKRSGTRVPTCSRLSETWRWIM